MTGHTDHRPPVTQLPAPRRLTVRFRGERSGAADLTWAQRQVWELCRRLAPHHHYFNLHRVIDTAGHTLTDVTRAVRLLVERYEAFRTTIGRDADDQPRQQVAATGELPVDVHDIDADWNVSAATELVGAEQSGHRFTDEEWPLRVAVVVRAGATVCVMLTASHVAVDRVGMDLACGAFRQLLSGLSAELPPATHQPLDEAATEASPAGRRRAERAAAYWRRTLLTVPHTMASRPAAAWAAARDPRPWCPANHLRSEAAAQAAELLAVRYETSPASVVLAALSALLSVHSGNGITTMLLFVGNRFAPQHHGMITTRVQQGLFAVDLRDVTFATAVKRTWAASLVTYRHAQYLPALVDEVIDDVSVRRGLHLDLRFQFHDRTDGTWVADRGRTADPAELTEALTRSSYHRDVQWDRHQQLRFDLRTEESAVLLRLAADPHVLSSQDVATTLRGVEALLVAAVGEDFPLTDIPTLTGLAPADQSAAVRADGCWVDPDGVRDLVADVPDVAAVHIDITGPPTDRRVVAHVATGNPDLSPADLHSACMHRVRSRPGATTPHDYVVHHTPGFDPGGRWWELSPVRCHGTGRVT